MSAAALRASWRAMRHIAPARRTLSRMVEQTYLEAFRPPSQAIQHVVAATVEVHGEHLVFLNAEGKLAALFMMEIVETWNVLPGT